MRKKLLIVCMVLLTAVCCIFGLSACFDLSGNNNADNSTIDNEQNGNQITDNNNSNNSNGDSSKDDTDEHKHTLTRHEKVDATCTTNGHKAYYTCSGCDKWFYDKAALNEIIDKNQVVFDKGHNLSLVEAKPSSCTADGNKAYYSCSSCFKLFTDSQGKNQTTSNEVTIKKSHTLTFCEEKPATCTADGNSAYYSCSKCSKLFEDINGKVETDKTKITIQKGHKLTTVAANPATCFTEGNTAYHLCNVCNKLFKDVNGKIETTLSQVTIAKAHNFVDKVCTKCGETKSTDGLEYKDKGDYFEVVGIGTVTDTDIVIPSTHNGKPVKAVASAFNQHRTLTSIVLPDSVETISPAAFYGCYALRDIKLPSGLKRIEGSTFMSCGLTSIDIPETVNFIGESAFWGTSLESVEIPEGITRINSGTFSQCTHLESVKLPESLTQIGDAAFNECIELKSITIPKNVYLIETGAFFRCWNLENLTFDCSNGYATVKLCERAFAGCILTSIVGSERIWYIDDYAFAETLINEINLRCISIGNYAFMDSHIKAIRFDGPKSDWNNLLKGVDWDKGTTYYTVYCSDGKIFVDHSL